MAQIKLIFACVFPILIFFQEIQPVEGRNLKLGEKKEVPKLQTHTKFLVKETRNIAEHISNMHGDSTNKTVHANESLPRSPSQVINESQPPLLGRHVDDFRTTSPGHSHGVGHSLQKESRNIADVDGFRPTTPGHSPGVGHSLQKESRNIADVDGFRPTTPGHSPGVGHSLQKETRKIAVDMNNLHGYTTNETVPANDSLPPAPSLLINEAQAPSPGHVVNDFRPTTPGHSPGVGHSLQN